MQMNIEKFLEEAGIEEQFYPGKRLVHACKQLGEYKNHSVVFDWRNPEKIRIELKAGLSGKDLEAKLLRKYPVCLQSPTYVEVEIVNDNEDQDDEEETQKGKASGKGGSGGKKPGKKALQEAGNIAQAFGEIVDSKIPNSGKIVDMMIMGMKIAESAYESVIGAFAEQIRHAKVAATDLMARASDMVTKYEPPSFMEKRGDETAAYEYDREKNADIGFRMTMA